MFHSLLVRLLLVFLLLVELFCVFALQLGDKVAPLCNQLVQRRGVVRELHVQYTLVVYPVEEALDSGGRAEVLRDVYDVDAVLLRGKLCQPIMTHPSEPQELLPEQIHRETCRHVDRHKSHIVRRVLLLQISQRPRGELVPIRRIARDPAPHITIHWDHHGRVEAPHEADLKPELVPPDEAHRIQLHVLQHLVLRVPACLDDPPEHAEAPPGEGAREPRDRLSRVEQPREQFQADENAVGAEGDGEDDAVDEERVPDDGALVGVRDILDVHPALAQTKTPD
mmetsp:Transcript_21293/g.52454  ORF Transcript_21293/g.52454 Transcript_21293/m.52454 type:complete len:281 (-) Transcript_21293:74-916(-)